MPVVSLHSASAWHSPLVSISVTCAIVVSTKLNNTWFVAYFASLMETNIRNVAFTVSLPAIVASGVTLVVISVLSSFPMSSAIAGNWAVRLFQITQSRSFLRLSGNLEAFLPPILNLTCEYTASNHSTRMRSSSVADTFVYLPIHCGSFFGLWSLPQSHILLC